MVLRTSDRLIVSVARLDPQKNPLGLIDAFAGALAADPQWRLLLVGDGSLRKQAEAHAGSLGLGARVHFLGVRPDIDALLPECDLFALASDWEGMPMAIIEAMAAGLPVAATAVGGVPELVAHQATGLLVPPGDTPALADALALLARDSGPEAGTRPRRARTRPMLRLGPDDRRLRPALRAPRGRPA